MKAIARHSRVHLGGYEERIDQFGRPTGGFNFDNAHRNVMLGASTGSKLPRATKTGTTIVGLVYKDGIVLGADTRATSGSTVCDKNCEKIHYIAPNIWCCGAGTAADTENVTAMVGRQLDMLRMATGVDSRVVTAVTKLKRHLFKYQGYVSAALVLGGVDHTGPHLYTVYPHGSTDKLPFVTMGSGSLAAMAMFEAGYREDMEEEDAKRLVQDAIRAGIFNDLGSGSNVDLLVIRRDGVENLRNMETPNEQSALRASIARPKARDFSRGTTPVLSTRIMQHLTVETEIVAHGAETKTE